MHKIFSLLFVFGYIFAQIPQVISFQGRLADTDGTPVSDGSYSLMFRMYESETGGSAIWTETQNATTTNGLFSIMLGEEIAFGTDVHFTIPLWLSIEIDAGGELSPRYQLGASPYAFVSIFSDTADFSHEAIFSHEAGFAFGAQFAETSAVAHNALSVDWYNVFDMPPGFADGIDNEGTGIAYMPGDGIDITGDVISVADYGITTPKIGDGAVSAEKIDISSGADGQILKIVGGVLQWANDETSGGTGGLTQVYHSPEFTGTGELVNPLELADDGIVASKLSDMGAASGEVLKWDGSSWSPASDLTGGAAGALNDLTDVNAPAPADGQVIKWNAGASEWQPQNDIGGGAGDDWGSQVVQSDATLDGDGTLGNELLIARQGAGDGQVLKWNTGSGRWIPANDSVGTGGTGGVGGSGIDNYIPRWNGTSDLENSSIYQADGGNVGIGTTSPSSQLELERATGTGLIIDNPGMDGIYIDSTSNNGIFIDSPSQNGVYISSPGSDGVDIYNAGAYGVYIDSPNFNGVSIFSAGVFGMRIDSTGDDGVLVMHSGGDGMAIGFPDNNGVFIQNAGHHGIEIDSCAWAGLYINAPAANGIDISASATTNCGIKIDSHYGDYPDTGIVINNVGSDGIVINDPVLQGISIYSADYGIYISSSDRDGLHIVNAGGSGISVEYSTNDGIYLANTGDDGLYVYNPSNDGVDVVMAGGTGDCFVCNGIPHLFRVSNNCEVFSHSYKQYIVDNDGRGIIAPHSASTAHWLEHIGEARLSGGECRVDLPENFLDGVTITKNLPMQVFLTPYGDIGRFTVEREETYFIIHQIEGDPDAEFAYRVVAKIWGSENDGIAHVDLQTEQKDENIKITQPSRLGKTK